jgi:hypothetical protein
MGLNIDDILKSLEEEKTAEAKFADGINDEKAEKAETSDEPVVETAETDESTKTADAADDEVKEEVATEEAAPEAVEGEATEEVADEAKSTDEATEEATEETTETVENSDEEVKIAEAEKTAAEYDAQGRIMARAFMDELEKVAVGTGAYTGHTADASKGPNQLVTGDIPEAGKADAVINQLKQYEAAAQGSYVQVNGAPMPAPSKAPDETKGSVAADMRPDQNQAIGGEAAVEKTGSADDDATPEERILGTLYNTYFQEEN